MIYLARQNKYTRIHDLHFLVKIVLLVRALNFFVWKIIQANHAF